jgi:hypothetical protein
VSCIANLFLSVQQGKYKGNGGISLRRVSLVHQILNSNTRFEDDPEASFFANKFKDLPEAQQVANDAVAQHFVLEGDFVEHPFAIHAPSDGTQLPPSVWDDHDNRMKMYESCTEIRMIIPTKFDREKCEKSS